MTTEKALINHSNWNTSIAVHFTPFELQIFQLLMTREFVTHEQIFRSLYDRVLRQPKSRVEAVLILRLRKKLKQYDVRIINKFGVGYFIPSAEKKKLNGVSNA